MRGVVIGVGYAAGPDHLVQPPEQEFSDVLTQYNAVVGVQRSFAETVNAYIEGKLAEE
jgi:hypothetical protein